MRRIVTKLRTPLLCALALAAFALLSGCASSGDGEHPRSLTDYWKKMRANQDAQAASFVETDIDPQSQRFER
jgi:hypothetical protein